MSSRMTRVAQTLSLRKGYPGVFEATPVRLASEQKPTAIREWRSGHAVGPRNKGRQPPRSTSRGTWRLESVFTGIPAA